MKRFVCHINNILYYDMRVGGLLRVKFIKLPYIVLIFVMLLGACEAASIPEEADEEETEYTDVEYSEDGSEIRLYLNGVGVPKTRAQRAITTELAKMAYNYIEVIFIGGGTVVRTAWELGYPANINGVARSVNYNLISDANAAPALAACMFVGRKDRKVLLGVGKLTGTRPSTGTTINVDTTSVTFTLGAIKTGLRTGDNAFDADSAFDSFTYTGIDCFITPPLGGIRYPMYILNSGVTTNATYTFSCGAGMSDYRNAIRHTGTTAAVQQRMPRYPDSIGYKEPRNSIIATPVVALGTYTPITAGSLFNAGVPIVFSSLPARGIFAFNIEIPVYMVSRTAPANTGGTASETWYIRTGVGSEFYSLDDGKARGGCVLMGIGISDLDAWNNIEWTWFK